MEYPNYNVVKKPNYYKAPLIFFAVIFSCIILVNYLSNLLGFNVFLLGGLIVSIILTIIFSVINIVFRFIANKFGNTVRVILWIATCLIIIFLAVGYYRAPVMLTPELVNNLPVVDLKKKPEQGIREFIFYLHRILLNRIADPAFKLDTETEQKEINNLKSEYEKKMDAKLIYNSNFIGKTLITRAMIDGSNYFYCIDSEKMNMLKSAYTFTGFKSGSPCVGEDLDAKDIK